MVQSLLKMEILVFSGNNPFDNFFYPWVTPYLFLLIFSIKALRNGMCWYMRLLLAFTPFIFVYLVISLDRSLCQYLTHEKGIQPKKVLGVPSVAWNRWWGPVGALGNSDYISKAFSYNSCVPLIKILKHTNPHVLLCTKTARTLFSWIKESYANCPTGPHMQEILTFPEDLQRHRMTWARQKEDLSIHNSAWHVVGVQ